MTTWKLKDKIKVIKGRLCIKGFAERGQEALHTASPTASRIGHRMVSLMCAIQGWEILSLDIATAFLQGWTFQEMGEAGFERQRCAFKPPAGVFEALAALSDVFKAACADPSRWCLELQKAAYGLKDAPLLWFLCITAFLKSLLLRPSVHDSCIFLGTNAAGELDIMLSLHVDDTLITGEEARCIWLHEKLESKFGKLKRESNCFKHFGLNVLRDALTKHVSLSQQEYLSNLQPIKIDRRRGDGRTAETDASSTEVGEYRSLVAGISWVGVTDPASQAGASMFQNALPQPKVSDLIKVNVFLEQIKNGYQPIVFRHGLKLNALRLFTIADSSLGNMSKYSQGGQIHMLSNADSAGLVGCMTMIHARSAKSKRVANSTMAAETLALVGGLESGQFIQTWIKELCQPTLQVQDLINDELQLIPHDLATDCNDLYEPLISPAFPNPSNRSLTLYLSYLREAREKRQVRAYLWTDTEDNLANGLTKLEKDGTLPVADIYEALRTSYWEPRKTYRWNGTYAVPVRSQHIPAIVINRSPPLPTNTTNGNSTSTAAGPRVLVSFDMTVDDDKWQIQDKDLESEPILYDWTTSGNDESD